MPKKLNIYKIGKKNYKLSRKAIVTVLIMATIASTTGCSSTNKKGYNNVEYTSSNVVQPIKEETATTSSLPYNYKASLDEASLNIIKSSFTLYDTGGCIDNITTVDNSYPNENLFEVEKALNEYKNVNEENIISLNIIKEGKIDSTLLYSTVLKNNEKYLKANNLKKYNSTTDDLVKSACQIITDYFSNGIDTENIDLNALDYKLSNLKIFAYNDFGYAFYSSEDGILGLNIKSIAALEKFAGDSNTFKKILEHEFAHVIQSGGTLEYGKRDGICYYFNDLEVNPLYWQWYFEGSAEQLMCKANGITSSENYLTEMRSLETIKTATILGSKKELENISLQKDLNTFFDYFNCKDDYQKIEIVNMMYAYNIINREDLCTDFFDSYEKENGEEMDYSQKMTYQTQLKGSIAVTLSSQFYTNLYNRINEKEVKIEDLFSIISVFETELSRQTWYQDPTKTEDLLSFLESYTKIQTEMFEMIALNLNVSTEQVQQAYNAYNDNYTVQNLNVQWLSTEENNFFQYIVDSRKADKKNSINSVYKSLNIKPNLSK